APGRICRSAGRDPDAAARSLHDGDRDFAQPPDPAAHPSGGAARAAQLHTLDRADRLLSGLQRSGLFLALLHQGDGPIAAPIPREAEQLAIYPVSFLEAWPRLF